MLLVLKLYDQMQILFQIVGVLFLIVIIAKAGVINCKLNFTKFENNKNDNGNIDKPLR